MPPKLPRTVVSRTVEFNSQELADIARMRTGMPPPAELAHKLAELVTAALRGQRITINLVRLP